MGQGPKKKYQKGSSYKIKRLVGKVVALFAKMVNVPITKSALSLVLDSVWILVKVINF